VERERLGVIARKYNHQHRLVPRTVGSRVSGGGAGGRLQRLCAHYVYTFYTRAFGMWMLRGNLGASGFETALRNLVLLVRRLIVFFGSGKARQATKRLKKRRERVFSLGRGPTVLVLCFLCLFWQYFCSFSAASFGRSRILYSRFALRHPVI